MLSLAEIVGIGPPIAIFQKEASNKIYNFHLQTTSKQIYIFFGFT